jgi:hypothetical protein
LEEAPAPEIVLANLTPNWPAPDKSALFEHETLADIEPSFESDTKIVAMPPR